MIFLSKIVPVNVPVTVVTSVLVLVGTAFAVIFGYKPFKEIVDRQEKMYATVLRGKLLIDVQPRVASIITAVMIAMLAVIFYMLLGGMLGAALGLALGAFLPYAVLKLLHRRRLKRLENQLVNGIQTLASGVRAGLNLVQSMQLVARDGPIPLKQEFTHLLREYEFGVTLDEAMNNAADRIGSADFHLLFAALQTHRQRGGNLGETLDRISESVREIQRLENRVKTLTAQGRATARWLGAMPAVVLTILYFINAHAVMSLFIEDLGKVIIFGIVVLNIVGFLWIKKIVSIDV